MRTVAAMGSFAIKDVGASHKFYKDTLGLDATIDQKMGILNVALPGGGKAMMYPKGDDHKPADFTVLNLIVQNLEAAVDELTEKGVEFEHYDNQYMKTDAKGIARTADDPDSAGIAWFTDPDGNILSLIEDR
jgi:hypothetical protein